MQELIWSIQPDPIIETGIAHGGSLIFSASMLELNLACGGPQLAEALGVDINPAKHGAAWRLPSGANVFDMNSKFLDEGRKRTVYQFNYLAVEHKGV